jgi:hypothetical protein
LKRNPWEPEVKIKTHTVDDKEYDLTLDDVATDLYDYFCKVQKNQKTNLDPFFEVDKKLKTKKVSNG